MPPPTPATPPPEQLPLPPGIPEEGAGTTDPPPPLFTAGWGDPEGVGWGIRARGGGLLLWPHPFPGPTPAAVLGGRVTTITSC